MQTIALPREFLPAVSSFNCFMLKAKGHNMQPVIHHGNHLICVRKDNLKEKDLAVLKRGHKYEVKYFRRLEGKPFYENANGEIFKQKGYRVIGKVSGVFNQICIK